MAKALTAAEKKAAAQREAEAKKAAEQANQNQQETGSDNPPADGAEPPQDPPAEQADTTNPNVTGTEVGIPVGLEPTPGVDTTAEHNAKMYGKPLPKGVTKEVLDANGNAKQMVQEDAKKGGKK